MGKSRETQIILKTDHRTVILKMLIGGKFQAKSGGWDQNRVFLGGDVREVEVCNGRWVLTRVPAGPRPAPPPAQHYFRPRSDGVTGYVTSSHGAATALRYSVTGHPESAGAVGTGNRAADEPADRFGSVAGPRLPSLDSPTGRSPRSSFEIVTEEP
jgi:hypothetical protein